MRSGNDAKTPGRRILRVVVVAGDKDIDGLSVEDEDGNPAIQVRVHVETSEKGEGGVNVWFQRAPRLLFSVEHSFLFALYR